MTVRYVEAPDTFRSDSTNLHWPSIFLAGGITECPQWREDVIRRLRRADTDLVVLNPRRPTFDVNDDTATEVQVRWEYEHLRLARHILFWFPVCDARLTVQPIALLELGAAMERDQAITVGADTRYPRRQDVQLQVAARRPELTVHSSVQATVAATMSVLNKPKSVQA